MIFLTGMIFWVESETFAGVVWQPGAKTEVTNDLGGSL